MPNTTLQYDSENVLVSKQGLSQTGPLASLYTGPTKVLKMAVIVTSIGTSFTIKLQESTDDNTFTDLMLTYSIDADGVHEFYFKATGPYLRANITAITGGSEMEVLLVDEP